MTEDEVRVMHGFLELSDEEQKDFIKVLNEYFAADDGDRKDFEERVANIVLGETRRMTKMMLGPLETPCPCCGK